MNKEDFLPIERTPQEEITSFIKRPSKWARFKVNRLAVVGATIIWCSYFLNYRFCSGVYQSCYRRYLWRYCRLPWW